jgi:hypothetical protein
MLCIAFVVTLAYSIPFTLDIDLPEMITAALVALAIIATLVFVAAVLFGAEVSRATPALSGSTLPVVRYVPDETFHPLLRGHGGALLMLAVLYGLSGQLVTCLLLHARKRRGAA